MNKKYVLINTGNRYFLRPLCDFNCSDKYGAGLHKVLLCSLTAPPISISHLATTFTPFTGSTKMFEAVQYKSLQVTTQIFECLIIQMQIYIVLFTLLTFSSVVVFAGLRKY